MGSLFPKKSRPVSQLKGVGIQPNESMVWAAGPGFRETAITDGPVIRKKTRKGGT